MTTGSRARYLIFALSVRKLTDALIEFVEEGRRSPDLNSRLRKVLASIEGTPGKTTSVKALRQRGSFGTYEGVLTLDDMESTDRKALATTLHSVITAKTEQEQKRSALQAIELFDILESRALYRYNHPAPRVRSVTA